MYRNKYNETVDQLTALQRETRELAEAAQSVTDDAATSAVAQPTIKNLMRLADALAQPNIAKLLKPVCETCGGLKIVLGERKSSKPYPEVPCPDCQEGDVAKG